MMVWGWLGEEVTERALKWPKVDLMVRALGTAHTL